MKFKISFYLVLMFIGHQAFSQEGIAVYSDYLNDNYYLIHPSMAGASTCTKVRATARQQWFDVEKAPALQTISANGQIGDNSGAGFILYNDRNGNHSQTGGKVSYAQHIKIGGDYLSLNRLQLGISAGFVQSRIDETGFGLDRIFDPTVGGITQKDNYFNFDIGASYLKNNFYMHLTYRNLATSRRELYTDVESDNVGKLLANVGYSFGNFDVVQLEPSIMYSSTTESKEQFLDINLKAYRNISIGRIWAGLSYRRGLDRAEEVDTDRGQRWGTITPILGVNFQEFMIAYNYTNTFGNVNYGGGFHQITLGIDLFCKSTSYDCNCPAVNNVN